MPRTAEEGAASKPGFHAAWTRACVPTPVLAYPHGSSARGLGYLSVEYGLRGATHAVFEIDFFPDKKFLITP